MTQQDQQWQGYFLPQLAAQLEAQSRSSDDKRPSNPYNAQAQPPYSRDRSQA